MTDLVSWLLAQIADDEAAARAASVNAERLRDQAERVANVYGDPDPPEDDIGIVDALWFAAQDAAEWIARHDPARVLADCAAKKAIVERCAELNGDVEVGVGVSPEQWEAQMTLRRLIQPYADRTGWREEWRIA